jgi:hypothetical protein
MLELNLAKARELIGLAIEEYGKDYVYPYSECVYALEADTPYILNEGGESHTINTPTAGCGVGVALLKGGISLDVLLNTSSDAPEALSHLSHAGHLKYTTAAAEFLWKFQCRQDSGSTWSSALEDAEAHMLDDMYGDTVFK